MNKKYLVFQVGCIECGVTSYPVKICDSLEEAKEIAKKHPDTWESEGGDGYVVIIDLESCGIVWQ